MTVDIDGNIYNLYQQLFFKHLLCSLLDHGRSAKSWIYSVTVWETQLPHNVLPLSCIQSVSLFYKCCYYYRTKWWMANASSSHWLFAEVLHAVTLTPHHVTSVHFVFIHVSPFQSAVIISCVPPACVCPHVSSPRLDATPLVSCLTRGKRGSQEGSLSVCDCSFLPLALHVWSSHGLCCTATQWCLKCYCSLLITVKERKKKWISLAVDVWDFNMLQILAIEYLWFAAMLTFNRDV